MKANSYPWPWLRQSRGPTRFPYDEHGWCPVCRFEHCRTDPKQAEYCRVREKARRREVHEELLLIAALVTLGLGIPAWVLNWLLDRF